MAKQEAQGELFVLDDSGNPSLIGMRCEVCGQVAFPEQLFGCEKCGESNNIHAEILACHGRLTSFAAVNLHRSDNISTPFVIGEITLESGPTIRITMVEDNTDQLSIGSPAYGIPVEITGPDGNKKTELRFTIRGPA